MTLPWPKKDPAPPAEKPLATVIITLNTDTGEIRVNGNCLIDTNLVLRMLVEAGHVILSVPAAELKAQEPVTH